MAVRHCSCSHLTEFCTPGTNSPSARTFAHLGRRISISKPVNAARAHESPQQEDLSGPPAANRHRLPNERVGLTHHFSIAGHEGYLTVGLYPNGQPGEIFIRMAKEGSTIAGLMECFGTVVSVSLQHGVPLQVLVGKLSHCRSSPRARPAVRSDLCEVDHGPPLSLDGIAISVRQTAPAVKQQMAVAERQGSPEANASQLLTQMWPPRKAAVVRKTIIPTSEKRSSYG
jgi:hypothetical protein